MARPDLLGYVLDLLDAQERADVEVYLRAEPTARCEVERLRQTLEPLAWDDASSPSPLPSPSPPEGLAERTLALIAACAAMRPLPISGRGGVPWRRMVEVAATMLIAATALGVAVTWIGRLRVQYPGGTPNPVDVVACKNNLQETFVLLRAYSDVHDGQFPNVAGAVETPRNAGGLVFAILHDSKLLPAEVKTACPSVTAQAPLPIGITEVKAMSDAAYQQWAKGLQNGYAYSLGYRQGDHLIGLRPDDSKPASLMPVMADSSPLDPLGSGLGVNHGGCGQNVLYCDGHVSFCQSRFVGYNLDDIYLSRDNKVTAGVDWSDAVLTSGVYQP